MIKLHKINSYSFQVTRSGRVRKKPAKFEDTEELDMKPEIASLIQTPPAVVSEAFPIRKEEKLIIPKEAVFKVDPDLSEESEDALHTPRRVSSSFCYT